MNFAACLVFVALGIPAMGDCCEAQSSAASNERLAAKAQQEYRAGQLGEAERDFARLVKRAPSNIYAHIYLGQVLFREQKYPASAVAFEKAHGLEKGGSKLSLDQHRILVDQLVMAYGISGNLKKAYALLQNAIQQDPEYPLNYYNLACAYAEKGKKEEALANLDLAFQHKDHILNGEQMPDPRHDSSFQKYTEDEDFIDLMKKLGYPAEL